MKTSEIHKHVRIRGRVFSANRRGDTWRVLNGWGQTPQQAAREATQSNTYSHADQPRTVAQLHDYEDC